MISISIIMPLYNAGKYLEESLRSVQQQTFTDFELICINDASTDGTMEILRDFQEKDSRIRILMNEKRSGAAPSRNRGMQEAAGKYLCFLDGDDIFEEEMLECAFRAAERCQTDVVVFELKHMSGDDLYRKQKVNHSEAFYQRYSSRTFKVAEYMPYEFKNWDFSAENKLLRREFIQDNQLCFQNLSCANDVYFMCMALLLAKRLLCLRDDRVMIYQREHNEPSRISFDRDPMCTYQAFVYIMEELIKRNRFSGVYRHYYFRLYCALRNALLQCKTEEKARRFYAFLKEEGMDTLCEMGGEYYIRLDDCYKNLLQQFKERNFDSEWYQRGPGLELQLSQEENIVAVTGLFDKFREGNKKIGVWGAGENGMAFLRFCKENNLHIEMLIDRSEKKQGKVIEGYRVEGPEDINDRIQAVIVTTRNIYAHVAEELSNVDIKAFDLNQMLLVY